MTVNREVSDKGQFGTVEKFFPSQSEAEILDDSDKKILIISKGKTLSLLKDS